MAAVLGTLGVNLLMFLRFFFPRALYEPKTRFRIGYPSDFGFGVDTKFQNQYRIWVVRNTEGIFVISAICTHLGCTPDWKPSENKFKCPCHGSGYDPEGINFEGPAPRPMDRAHVELDPEGQILVDLSHVYRWPKGEPSQFGDPRRHSPRVRSQSWLKPTDTMEHPPANGSARRQRQRATATTAKLGDRAGRRARPSRRGRVEEIKETIKAPEKTDVWKSRPARQARRDAAQPRAGRALATSSCTCIRPRSIATRWPTTTPGAWAA